MYLVQPGTQRHARIWNTGGVTTTNKYLQAANGDGFHSGELQSTLRQTLSCSMYPQGSCVPAPTRDPTSRAVPEHWGCDHNSLVLSVEMGAILVSCKAL